MDYQTVNVKAQVEYRDETQLSVWQFWQRDLRDRKEHKDVFVHGDFKIVDEANGKIFAYVRAGEIGGSWLVVLNWCGDATSWEVPNDIKVAGWMAGTYVRGKPEKSTSGKIRLEPWEGLLARCQIQPRTNPTTQRVELVLRHRNR